MAELSRARLCSLYLTAMEARPAPDLTPHLRTSHPTALSVFHAGAGQGTQRRALGGGLRAAGTGHLSRAHLSPRATPPPPPPASHGTRSPRPPPPSSPPQERLAHELWAWGVHIDEHPRTHRDKQRELLSRALGHARLRSGVVYR